MTEMTSQSSTLLKRLTLLPTPQPVCQHILTVIDKDMVIVIDIDIVIVTDIDIVSPEWRHWLLVREGFISFDLPQQKSGLDVLTP